MQKLAGKNDSVSRIFGENLDDLFQLISFTTKTLPNCKVISLQPVLWVNNGKAALTLHYLNKNLSQLNLHVADNRNAKTKYVRQKGIHIVPKGKDRLALNSALLTNKIRSLWWSSKHLNIPTKPCISPNNSLNKYKSPKDPQRLTAKQKSRPKVAKRNAIDLETEGLFY